MPEDPHTHLKVLDGGRRAGLTHAAFSARATQPLSTIVHVVGTRPNFVKMAPVVRALAERCAFRQVVVHTGQHYDANLSDQVLADLDFPSPDRFLGVGSGSHSEQTARAIVAFERVLLQEQPVVVVVADGANSTLACALAASRCGIPVVHLEAGLRSFDWTMPEEVNRVLTDRLSDTLLAPSPEAVENLRSEGIVDSCIHHVGNTLVDSLRRAEPRARARRVWEQIGVAPRSYVLLTLHRPSNVDVPARLSRLVGAITGMATRFPVIFPLHPRTRARLGETGIARLEAAGVRCVDPLGYLDFLSLQCDAGAVVTDSGGVQDETCALGVRCFTFSANTDRPITLSRGTNVLLGDDPARLAEIELATWAPTPSAIPLWDGHAGERVADALVANYALTRFSTRLRG